MLPRNRIPRISALFGGVVVIGLLAVTSWRWLSDGADESLESSDGGFIRADFQLVDQHGQLRNSAGFRGQFMLVFFGFTHCPDICPVELQTMTVALESLGTDADQVTPIFITVDPARDTSEALRDYVANFHPRFVALTGSEAETGAVAKNFRVYYAKSTGTEASDDPSDYIMDHSAIVYLIGPDGAYIAHFNPGTPAEDMAAGLRKHL